MAIFHTKSKSKSVRVFQDEKNGVQLMQVEAIFRCPMCNAAYHPLVVTMHPKPISADSVVQTMTLHQIRGIVRFADGWVDPVTSASKTTYIHRYVIPSLKAGKKSLAIVGPLVAYVMDPLPTTFFMIDCLSCPCTTPTCPGFILISDTLRATLLASGPLSKDVETTLAQPLLSWTDFIPKSHAAFNLGLEQWRALFP